MLKFQQNRKEPELIRIPCVTCPGAETMTLEITRKLKISATMLCGE